MKLLGELEGAFVVREGIMSFTTIGDNLADAHGVIFNCPKCQAEGKSHGILCWFTGRVLDDAAPGPGRWQPSGTGLADLSLERSIEARGRGCGWHGRVLNGEATADLDS